jgi:hypothetical protein
MVKTTLLQPAEITLLTPRLVYANLPFVVGGLNQSASQGGLPELREAT